MGGDGGSRTPAKNRPCKPSCLRSGVGPWRVPPRPGLERHRCRKTRRLRFLSRLSSHQPVQRDLSSRKVLKAWEAKRSQQLKSLENLLFPGSPGILEVLRLQCRLDEHDGGSRGQRDLGREAQKDGTGGTGASRLSIDLGGLCLRDQQIHHLEVPHPETHRHGRHGRERGKKEKWGKRV